MLSNKIAFLLSVILAFAPGSTGAPQDRPAEDTVAYSGTEVTSAGTEEVYLGVKNYGSSGIGSAAGFTYRFCSGSEVRNYRMGIGGGSYTLQNRLEEGQFYVLEKDGDYVTDVKRAVPDAVGIVTYIGEGEFRVGDRLFLTGSSTGIYCILSAAGGSDVVGGRLVEGDTVAVFCDGGGNALRVYNIPYQGSYEPPVKAEPGVRTVKNLLSTATQPMGTTLYVYGGGWNWQDNGGNELTSSIGIPQSWINFFNGHDANYRFYTENASRTYYPTGNYNEYNRCGLDCSGYVSWVIYNTLNSSSGLENYVSKSTGYAKKLAEEYGYGTYHPYNYSTDFKPGDIMSMQGHVWMCVGVCADGSVVIMHSTPGESVTGCRGGGPQLSAVGGRQSEAYALASKYMSMFYPEWSSRYNAVAFSYSDYIPSGGTVGRFSWNTENGPLADPEGIRNMSAEEVLRVIYGE